MGDLGYHRRNAGFSSATLEADADARQRCETIFLYIRKVLGKMSPAERLLKAVDPDLDDRDLKAAAHELFKYVKSHRSEAKLPFSDSTIYQVYDQRYFYRNLYKYIVLSFHLQTNYPRYRDFTSIIDVGAGSGAFSIAWVMTRRAILGQLDVPLLGNPVSLIVNDIERFQVLLSIHTLRQLFDVDELRLIPAIADIGKAEVDPDASLMLWGYVASSLESLSSIPFECNAVIVDYPEKVATIERQCRLNGVRVMRFKIKVSAPSRLMDIKSVGLSVNTVITGPLSAYFD